MTAWCGAPDHAPDAAAHFFDDVERIEAACPACGTQGALTAAKIPPHSGRPGRRAVSCAGGCPVAEVCRALGLAGADLFDSPGSPYLRPVRRVPGPDECPMCFPDYIDAVFDRLYGGSR